MNYIILLILIPIFKFLTNLYYFLFLKKLQLKYKNFVKLCIDKKDREDVRNWLEENSIKLKNAVKNTKSNLHLATEDDYDDIGIAIKHQLVTVIDNLTVENTNMMVANERIIKRTKGYYVNGMKDSFNPLYWISLISNNIKSIIKFLVDIVNKDKNKI